MTKKVQLDKKNLHEILHNMKWIISNGVPQRVWYKVTKREALQNLKILDLLQLIGWKGPH